jgi:ABC-2 type transport system ATP-binding protein
MYRFHFNVKYLPAEEIVMVATKKKWGLFHIAPDITSLEDIFVQLTKLEK